MEISNNRREILKKALYNYSNLIVATKFKGQKTTPEAKKELQETLDFLNDVKLIEKCENIDVETPTGPEIEQLINEDEADLINDVDFSDMEIKPLKK